MNLPPLQAGGVQYAFKQQEAELDGAAELLSHFDGELEPLKNLAYRLYNTCERRHWAREGTGYNDLVVAWNDILSRRNEFMQKRSSESGQMSMF